jgi:carbonic anhydrase/acetyltransferase-like protein (isoleucine patch superfamily)
MAKAKAKAQSTPKKPEFFRAGREYPKTFQVVSALEKALKALPDKSPLRKHYDNNKIKYRLMITERLLEPVLVLVGGKEKLVAVGKRKEYYTPDVTQIELVAGATKEDQEAATNYVAQELESLYLALDMAVQLHGVKEDENAELEPFTWDEVGRWAERAGEITGQEEPGLSTLYQEYDKLRKELDGFDKTLLISGFTEPDTVVASTVNLENVDADRMVVRGSATVEDYATLEGSPVIEDHAAVKGNATVKDAATVSGGAEVTDEAVIEGNAYVGGSALVGGNSIVSDNAEVTDDAEVIDCRLYERAFVGGQAKLYRVKVYGNAVIEGTADISGEAVIYGGTWDGSEGPIVGGVWHDGPRSNPRLRPRTRPRAQPRATIKAKRETR